MNDTVKSHLALFGANLAYGANYVVAKGLMPDPIGPNGFIFFRVSGAALLFWLLYLLFFYEPIKRNDFVRLAICGLFGVACNQLLFFNGLMLTSPVNAPVIMTTTPILVLILSAVILKQKVLTLQWVGVVIGAVGSVMLTLLNSEQSFATGIGDVFIFLNAISYSFYLILVKPLMETYRPITVISWVFLFGLVYVSIWPYTLPEAMAVDWGKFDFDKTWRFLFVVVGVTFVPYLLNIFSMKKLSAYIAAVYIYTQPILATFFIYVFYLLGKEDYTGDFNWTKVVSSLLIFGGVYLVIRPPKPKAGT